MSTGQSVESPGETIARLRRQNKEAADARDKAMHLLERKYRYYQKLFSHALKAATEAEQQNVCALCHREHSHKPHQVAQASQLAGALRMLFDYAEENVRRTQ